MPYTEDSNAWMVKALADRGCSTDGWPPPQCCKLLHMQLAIVNTA